MASFLPRQGNTAGYPVNTPRYENKKINGAIAPNGAQQQQPQQQPQQQQHPQQQQQQQQMAMEVRTKPPPQPQQVRPSGAAQQQPQEINGIGISNVLNSAAAAGTPADFGGMYSNTGPGAEAGLDKYLGSSGGAATNQGGRVPSGPNDMTNGMYGQHELVAAISQITADQTATNAAAQQAKAFNKAKRVWPENAPGQSPGKQDPEAAANAPRGYGGRPQNASGGSRQSNSRYSGGSNNQGGQGPPDMTGNDGASDSMSSTSEEVVTTNAAAAVAIAGELGDNGKPLSFARIASLNLEKQAVHRPRKPIQIVAPVTSENAAQVAPGGMDPQGNFVSSMGQHAGQQAAACQAAMMQQQQQQQPSHVAMPPQHQQMASMSVAEAVVAAQQGMASMHGGHPYPNQVRAYQ